MSALEFIIELINSYLHFLSIIATPLVVLIIFGALWFAFRNALKSVSPGRRVPVTWKGMHTLLSNLESQLLSHQPESPEEQHRQDMVKHELQTAREAAERRDHHTMLQSISTLTQMAAHDDRKAQQWKIPQAKTVQIQSPEMEVREQHDHHKQ